MTTTQSGPPAGLTTDQAAVDGVVFYGGFGAVVSACPGPLTTRGDRPGAAWGDNAGIVRFTVPTSVPW
ncbi:hypothetical protein J2X68_007540 [Streptomyces sp. 3330]|uniref:hypothetical protein n=1 Tax=Streptomyces sp. 3330 TaxID=2817755 RepID=UPI002858A892|nr:hypothetical protein [Streptomyces sp. 3330]MDR6980798.1 hypothetical protein [Streptomyces sp. 3330]